MKYPVLIVGAVCLSLTACASPNQGNPDGAAYVGATGSVYEASANPPRTNGTVSYDPNAPIPPDPAAAAPSGAAMPAPPPARMPR
jgi:hypothetical protein